MTFYTRHGDWLPHLSLAIVALALARGATTSRRRRARSSPLSP
jgi:apolipoprotein N-acyltransferase